MFDKSAHMQTVKILENALDTSTLRQKVIADNIANVNTPRFKGSYVSFEDELAQALQKKQPSSFKAITLDPRHIQFYKPQKDPTQIKARVNVENDTFFRNDGNNVDINIQMANLAKNSIMYEAMIKRITGSLQMLQTVIKGGR